MAGSSFPILAELYFRLIYQVDQVGWLLVVNRGQGFQVFDFFADFMNE